MARKILFLVAALAVFTGVRAQNVITSEGIVIGGSAGYSVNGPESSFGAVGNFNMLHIELNTQFNEYNGSSLYEAAVGINCDLGGDVYFVPKLMLGIKGINEDFWYRQRCYLEYNMPYAGIGIGFNQRINNAFWGAELSGMYFGSSSDVGNRFPTASEVSYNAGCALKVQGGFEFYEMFIGYMSISYMYDTFLNVHNNRHDNLLISVGFAVRF